MEIRDTVKRHDRMAFEMKLEFPAPEQSNKPQEYKVEMYLFVPQSLDINRQNYTRQDFYRALKTNIRLTTPDYLTGKIVNGEKSPFARLSKSIEKLSDARDSNSFEEYEMQIKRLCSVFGSSLRHLINHLSSVKSSEDKIVLINEFLVQSVRVRNKFKGLRARLNIINNSKAFKLFQIADEYQSLLLEKHVFILIERLKKKKLFAAQIERLIEIAYNETQYRKKSGYPSIVGLKQPNRDVLHRNSMLKKHIESNLFLNTDTRREAVLAEQILFAVAAGIAMVFATSVAFLSQMVYGRLSMPFFIALVISYMFKDRIKELMRFYFDKKHKKFFSDYKTTIFTGGKKKMGMLKESFQFIKKRNLPDDILLARDKMRKTDLDIEILTEKVLLFRNRISLFGGHQQLDDFEGITQILRFNIWDLTLKMDDPEKEIYYVGKRGLKQINVDRVYYFNLIMRYSTNGQSVIKAHRIAASKHGIKRVEIIL